MAFTTVIVLVLVTVAVFTGLTLWSSLTRRGHRRSTRNSSTADLMSRAMESFEGIDRAMINLSAQFDAIPSSPWTRKSTAIIGSVRARLRQTQYDLDQLTEGGWRLDDSIHSTLNFLQQETGVVTKFLIDIRPDHWNEDLQVINVARIIQETIYVAFLQGSLSEVHIRLEIDSTGKIFIEIRDNREAFSLEQSENQLEVTLAPVLEKVQSIHGQIEVSSASDRGTIVRVTGQLQIHFPDRKDKAC